jgi:hypothetical protein
MSAAVMPQMPTTSAARNDATVNDPPSLRQAELRRTGRANNGPLNVHRPPQNSPGKDRLLGVGAVFVGSVCEPLLLCAANGRCWPSQLPRVSQEITMTICLVHLPPSFVVRSWRIAVDMRLAHASPGGKIPAASCHIYFLRNPSALSGFRLRARLWRDEPRGPIAIDCPETAPTQSPYYFASGCHLVALGPAGRFLE